MGRMNSSQVEVMQCIILSKIIIVSKSTTVAAAATAYTQSSQQRTSRSQLSPLSSIKRYPKTELTGEEQAHYNRVVGHLLYRAVQEYAAAKGEIDCNAWRFVHKDDDMPVGRSLKGTGDPRVSLMLDVSKVEGSLEDDMNGMYSDSEQDHNVSMELLSNKFIIGSVMQVRGWRTLNDLFNFAGIKRFVISTPGGGVMSDRGILYCRWQGTMFDTEGNEIAYLLMQSIDRPEWSANAFKNVLHSHCSFCYLQKYCGDKVECFIWGEFYGSGSILQLLSDYAAAGRFLAVKNALKVSKAKKLSQWKEGAGVHVLHLDRHCTDTGFGVSSGHYRTTCFICAEPRGIFSSQQLCGGRYEFMSAYCMNCEAGTRSSTFAVCLRNVCKSCSEKKKFYTLNENGWLMRDRFCKKVRHHRRQAARLQDPPGWGSASTAVEVQKPLAFYSVHGRGMLDSISSTISVLTNGSEIDTSSLDESLQQRNGAKAKERSGFDEADWEQYEQIRRNYAERLSRSSRSVEQHLSDIFEDTALLER